MRTPSNSLFLFALVFGGACTAPSQGDDFGTHVSREEAESLDIDAEDPAIDTDGDDTTEGEGETGSGEGEGDGGEGVDEPLWDATTPELVEGLTVEAEVECGLALGPFSIAWAFEGGSWRQLPPPGASFVPRTELQDCLGQGPKRFEWEADGTLYWESAGLAHTLLPTETEDRWFGGVEPIAAPSPECTAALEANGLSWPLPIMLELTRITAP